MRKTVAGVPPRRAACLCMPFLTPRPHPLTFFQECHQALLCFVTPLLRFRVVPAARRHGHKGKDVEDMLCMADGRRPADAPIARESRGHACVAAAGPRGDADEQPGREPGSPALLAPQHVALSSLSVSPALLTAVQLRTPPLQQQGRKGGWEARERCGAAACRPACAAAGPTPPALGCAMSGPCRPATPVRRLPTLVLVSPDSW